MRHCGALLSGLLLLSSTGVASAAAPVASPIVALAGSAASDRVGPDLSARGGASIEQRTPQSDPVRLPRTLIAVLLIGGALSLVMLLTALLSLRRSRDRIAAANAELRQANASLEQALQARTDFLATTSHEIRTPLNGILGMTQILLTDRQIDAAVRERISVVHDAGESMKALVDDLLDLAKIDGGEVTIEQVPLDLPALVEEVERLWHGQAERKGLQIELDLGACPEWIEGDPVRIRQVLLNLLSNALKFTADGAIGISAFAEPADGGEALVLQVRDTGIGIAADQQARVFEKFRQADASITRRFGGTGLGLPICRSIVEAMGGSIDVASSPGAGATFSVRLPLIRTAEAASPAPSTQATTGTEARMLGEARLLIVEQNALTRRILCNMLHGTAAGVEAVATVQEARERLAAGGIDHVIADTASGAGDPSGRAASIERLASRASAVGARMTLLFPPRLAPEAARIVAARPEVQAIAKPIAAPDLVDALVGQYGEVTGPGQREFVPATAALSV
jgi:signal transduction histidine kinase